MTHDPRDLVLRVERGVLGAALRDETCRRVVLGLLTPADYLDPAHGGVHAALVTLDGRGAYVDWDGVLRAGDRKLLASVVRADLEVVARGKTLTQIEAWSRALRAEASARRLRAEVERASADSLRPGADPSAYFERIATAVSRAQQQSQTRGAVGASELVQEFWGELCAPDTDGLPTGIAALDSHLGGLRPSRSYVIAARSGMGKTALAGSITRAVCKRGGGRVLFCSLEMPRTEVMRRLISAEAHVDSQRIERRQLTPDEVTRLEAAAPVLHGWPLIVDDDAVTAGELCARAAVAHATSPLSLLIVDYLTLLSPGRDSRAQSREQEVAAVSRSLKQLSKALKIPVVVLAQLNKDSEKRGDKRPHQSDLRESEAITNDADTVLLLFRQGMYDTSIPKSSAEIIVAKNRGGPTGTVRARYVETETIFLDAEDDARAPYAAQSDASESDGDPWT